MQNLYRTRQPPSARPKRFSTQRKKRDSDSGSCSGDGESDSEDSGGESEETNKREGGKESNEEVPTQGGKAAAEAQRAGSDPFVERIVAHAGCTRKLWRSRYRALKEVKYIGDSCETSAVLGAWDGTPLVCICMCTFSACQEGGDSVFEQRQQDGLGGGE